MLLSVLGLSAPMLAQELLSEQSTRIIGNTAQPLLQRAAGLFTQGAALLNTETRILTLGLLFFFGLGLLGVTAFTTLP